MLKMFVKISYNFLKQCHWILEQAGAELCQAQVKLEVVFEVGVEFGGEFGVEVEASYYYSWWLAGWVGEKKTKLMLYSTLVEVVVEVELGNI